jgi:hypothetical protein
MAKITDSKLEGFYREGATFLYQAALVSSVINIIPNSIFFGN